MPSIVNGTVLHSYARCENTTIYEQACLGVDCISHNTMSTPKQHAILDVRLQDALSLPGDVDPIQQELSDGLASTAFIDKNLSSENKCDYVCKVQLRINGCPCSI